MTSLNKYTIIAFVFLLSICSMIYELLLANINAQIMSNNNHIWYTITISFYLMSLGIGAFLYKENKDLNLLIKVEYIISWLIMLLIPILYISYDLSILLNKFILNSLNIFTFNHSYQNIYIIISLIITILMGILSGFEMPIFIKLIQKYEDKNHINYILSANYFGVLIASLSFSLILTSYLNNMQIALIFSFINFSIYFYITFLNNSLQISKIFIIGITWSFLFNFSDIIENIYLKKYYNHLNNGDLSKIQRINTKYQKIDYFYKKHGNNKFFTLFLNSNFQFSEFNEIKYHEAMAHIPIQMTGLIPKSVLIVGAGDGLLAREILKYKKIKNIKLVELDKKMIDLGKTNTKLRQMNQKSLLNNRVNIVIKDGYFFVKNTKEKFNGIYIDLPYPYNYDLSKLYSVEFYKFLKKNLKKDAFICINAPLINMNLNLISNKAKKINSIIINTISAAGYEMIFPYSLEGEGFLFFTKNKIKLDNFFIKNYGFDMKYIDNIYLRSLSKQNFPYIKSKYYINSIFKPLITNI